jgi:hypothetical protein
MEAERGAQQWHMMFTVVDGWTRYPLDILVDTTMSWNQILESWYQKAAITPGWDVQKYPRNPTACVMKDGDDNAVEHIDGKERVFAYYAPSLTTAVQPQAPKQKQAAAVPSPQVKPIALQAVEMTSGDVITLQNIAKYDEAIPTVQKYANIPNDWTMTVIDNKPTLVIVACAPPSYVPITPEKYNDLARHAASTLTATPKPRAIPKAVMLHVTYVHLTPGRKDRAKKFSFRMEEDDEPRLVLAKWIELGKNATDHWDAISRKMSFRPEDYQWFTGMDNPL